MTVNGDHPKVENAKPFNPRTYVQGQTWLQAYLRIVTVDGPLDTYVNNIIVED